MGTTHTVRNAEELDLACKMAAGGDTILVHGGLYDKPVTVCGRHGTARQPITFRAADAEWIRCGRWPDPYDDLWPAANIANRPALATLSAEERIRVSPSRSAPYMPMVGSDAFLKFKDCSGIVVDGLRVRDSWPSILFLQDTHHLTVRNCRFLHGRYAICARGEDTAYLLLDSNHWQQDDSPDHALWTRIAWKRSHGNEGSDGLYRYFNGGFFGAKGIRGQVVIRGNRIQDAYNGIRMKAADKPLDAQAQKTVNADVHIVDNDFVRIRDNPVEPERSAWNWHVRHNRLVDCHAWFSMDGVSGGFWYFYGNTGRFDSRQGDRSAASHSMGRVLKLSYEQDPPDATSEAVPTEKWYVFNNSWHLRCPVVGGSSGSPAAGGAGPDFTAHLHFFNNAFTWCDPGVDGPWVCEDIEPLRHFDLARSADTHFDHDLCDRSGFVDYLRHYGTRVVHVAREGEEGQVLQVHEVQEVHGIVSNRPIFVDGRHGDFALAVGSAALGSGKVGTVALATGGPEAPLQPLADGTLNRGAWQAHGLVRVPLLEAQTTVLMAEMAS